LADDLLVADGLTGGYGDIEVLHGMSFVLSSGEVVALFGPNGAGKTTLLTTLAGLLPLTGGEIRWSGDRSRLAPHKLARRGVVFVPDRSVIRQLTVEANLRLGPGAPEKAYMLFPELRALAHRRAGLLSGGEQQMVALGRALAAEPTVLLIDELSLGLAPIVVSRLLDAVRQAADRGVGVLLVEQQVERALAVADRGYIVSRGAVVSSGTRAELMARERSIASDYFS
jgi:branched-chain amino acid transport system ATP-binding protein